MARRLTNSIREHIISHFYNDRNKALEALKERYQAQAYQSYPQDIIDICIKYGAKPEIFTEPHNNHRVTIHAFTYKESLELSIQMGKEWDVICKTYSDITTKIRHQLDSVTTYSDLQIYFPELVKYLP
jgi:hypothetical protein